MAVKNDTTLHRKYLKSFLPLILLMNSVFFLITSGIFVFNSYKQYEEIRHVINEVVGINFSLLEDINVLYDFMFSRTMEEYLFQFRDEYERAGHDPGAMDLESLKGRWGAIWDLYVIDDRERVIYSSYEQDVGLDFRETTPLFARRLALLREGGDMVIDNISREIRSDMYRKYGYVPSPDRRFILELGAAMPADDRLFRPINSSYLAEKFGDLGNQNLSIEILEFKEFDNEESPLAVIRRDMKEAGDDQREEWLLREGVVKNYFNFSLDNVKNPMTFIEYFVCISYSLDSFWSRLKQGIVLFLAQILLLTLLTLILISRLTLSLTRPIALMVEDIRLISSGCWDHRLSSGETRELNTLKGSVDQLVRSLLSEKSEVELYESRYRLAIDASRDIIMEWRPSAHFLSFSKNCVSVFGCDPGKRTGRELEIWSYRLLCPESIVKMKDRARSLIRSDVQGEVELELRLRTDKEEERWILLKGYVERWGEHHRMIGIIADISQANRRRHMIESLAYTNAISGYPNLQSLYETGAAFSRGSLIGVVLLNLDDLGRVYTAFGYEQGHKIMKVLCLRIKEILLGLGLDAGLFHINSDDLVLLFSGYENAGAMRRDVELLGEALNSGLFLKAGDEFFFTISLGAEVERLSESADIQILLHRAEMALDRAKAQGKNSLVFYLESFSGDSKKVFSMTRSLSNGLQTDKLSMVYQPIVERRDGDPPGFEALLRLEEGSRISPAEYIMAAEDTGLIHPLGEWIMNSAVRQAGRLLEMGLDFHYISINFSPLQFREQRLPERLSGLCRRYGVPPGNIQVELTETAIMLSADRMLEMISTLKSLGFRIAMDDFGTGYSSLAYLSRLPIDALKIDKGMTDGVLVDEKLKRVVSLIMEVARELSLEVIAEGIETAEQERWMLDQNCRHHQGYLYSRPLGPEDMERWLRQSEEASPPCGRSAPRLR